MKKIAPAKSVPKDPRYISNIPFWKGWMRLKDKIYSTANIKKLSGILIWFFFNEKNSKNNNKIGI